MNEFLRFLTANAHYILFFLAIFGSGVAAFISSLVKSRNERLEREAARRHELAILAERKKLAEAVGGGIELLIVDRSLAEDFMQRLKEALARGRKTGVRIETHELDVDGLEDDDSRGNERSRSRKGPE